MPHCLHWRVPLAITNVWYEGDRWKYRCSWTWTCNLGPEHTNDPLAGTHGSERTIEPVPSSSRTGTFFILILISYSLSSLPPPLCSPAVPRSTMKLPWRFLCRHQDLNAPNTLTVPTIPSPGRRRHGDRQTGKGASSGKVPDPHICHSTGSPGHSGRLLLLSRKVRQTSLHPAASEDQALCNSGLSGLAPTTHNVSAEVRASGCQL